LPFDDQYEREVRAARNQSLFRAVNEKITHANEALAWLSGTLVIACECADTTCVQTLEIEPEAYTALRSHPNRFAVLPGHVYLDVEREVTASNGYIVVEKNAAVEHIVQATDPRGA
jgi:hypothetical protein